MIEIRFVSRLPTPGGPGAALLKRRTTRNVIGLPSTYGIDNSLMVKSIAEFALKHCRGVAVVNTS